MKDGPNRPLVGIGVVVFKDDRVPLVRRAKPPRPSMLENSAYGAYANFGMRQGTGGYLSYG